MAGALSRLFFNVAELHTCPSSKRRTRYPALSAHTIRRKKTMSYQFDTTQLRNAVAAKPQAIAPSARLLSRRNARQARRLIRAI